MRSVRRQHHVPYTPEQMFDLVNDVDAYPDFLHWCRGSSVEKISETEAVATVEVGIGGIRRSFTTRNTLARPGEIAMGLVSGPFDALNGNWSFAAAANGGCAVELNLAFEVSATPLEMLFASLFEEVVHTQVAAFVSRAHDIYGNAAEDRGVPQANPGASSRRDGIGSPSADD